MQAILYVGHGTRSRKGAEEAKQFLQKVITRVDVPIQEISFLELTVPSIEEGFIRCIARGATRIAIVPLFLLAAGHIKKDIPQALQSLQQLYPHISVRVADPFGVQDVILDGIAEMIRDTAGELDEGDSVLIVGRGSSDSEIHQSFASITAGIKQRLAVTRIAVCYLAATTPSFLDGIEEISQESLGKVVIVPYLLFGGLLLSEVQAEVRKRQKVGQLIELTPALSKHGAIQKIIIERASQKGSELCNPLLLI